MSKKSGLLFLPALKLIEQLYKDGKIPNFMYRNILNEYADIVDVTAFVIGNSNKKGGCDSMINSDFVKKASGNLCSCFNRARSADFSS